MPAIDGDTVVWQQFVAEYGDYDICVADLSILLDEAIDRPEDPLLFVIGEAGDQTNPDVYQDVVVWQEFVTADGSGDFDIRAADISDPNEAVIFAVTEIVDNDEQNPAIHGRFVVWQDGPAGDFGIYGADITDLESPIEFPIANFEADQQNPAIYRNTIVWQDTYFGDWDILATDIWLRNRPADFGVSLIEHEQTNPAVSGDVIVWQDNFSGNWDIYAADFSTSVKAGFSDPNDPVEFAIATGESSQTNPAIDGHLIVWQDDRAGNWDIFGYNLTTRRQFRITDDAGDQTNPAISGNAVVWQDNRDGNPQIYAAVLDRPEVASCRTRLPGDVNGDCRVDFDDFTIMAANWLECHLEPPEACPPY